MTKTVKLWEITVTKAQMMGECGTRWARYPLFRGDTDRRVYDGYEYFVRLGVSPGWCVIEDPDEGVAVVTADADGRPMHPVDIAMTGEGECLDVDMAIERRILHRLDETA